MTIVFLKRQWKTANAKATFEWIMETLRLITCGNVDDGKSTLIGRLLFDTKSIFEDQLQAVQRASERSGHSFTNLALFTDGLRSERANGITIDVAYRYFATSRRKFILADCPGHFQYTRNMVTGASSAQLALILVDVRNTLTEQAYRHTFLAVLLGIKHIVVCINKMDLVDFRQSDFNRMREQFLKYTDRFDRMDIQFIPMSARDGDNVAERSSRMPWFAGECLLSHLETVCVQNDINYTDARFPVQTVIRKPDSNFCGLAGRVASGVFRLGDNVIHMPSGLVASIVGLYCPAGRVAEAFCPMSITMELDRDLNTRRGDLLATPTNQPMSSSEFEIMLCWLGDEALDVTRAYFLQHTSRQTHCWVRVIHRKIDVATMNSCSGETPVRTNDLAIVTIQTAKPVFIDTYQTSKTMGSLILIDELTNITVGAGILTKSSP